MQRNLSITLILVLVLALASIPAAFAQNGQEETLYRVEVRNKVVALLHVGEFAAVLGLTPDENWARVDLGPGNTGSSAAGWVEATTLNVNGPCDSLPTIRP